MRTLPPAHESLSLHHQGHSNLWIKSCGGVSNTQKGKACLREGDVVSLGSCCWNLVSMAMAHFRGFSLGASGFLDGGSWVSAAANGCLAFPHLGILAVFLQVSDGQLAPLA